jgi:hypothetical protein
MSTYDPNDTDPFPTFTTHPKRILSWNTAFNAAVWGVSAGYVGSYLTIPTPYGSYNAGAGAGGLGVAAYAALVLYNLGFDGVWDNIEKTIVDWGSDIEPFDKDKVKQFTDRYGVDPVTAFKRWYKEHPEEVGANDAGATQRFLDWCDATYLGLFLVKPYYPHVKYSYDDTVAEFKRRYGRQWQGQFANAIYAYETAYTRVDPHQQQFIDWCWAQWFLNHPGDGGSTSPALDITELPQITNALTLNTLSIKLKPSEKKYSYDETVTEFKNRYGRNWQGQFAMAIYDFTVGHSAPDPKSQLFLDWVWAEWFPVHPGKGASLKRKLSAAFE